MDNEQFETSRVVAMTSLQIAGNVPEDWADNEHMYDFHHRQMTISDGQGGVLTLDLTQPGLDELARAFDTLLTGTLPHRACLMRVQAGKETFLLWRVKHAPASVGITRLGAQSQEISLSEDVLRLVTRMLAKTEHLRAPSTEQFTQPPDD